MKFKSFLINLGILFITASLFADPMITSISSFKGPESGGTVVVIEGSGFSGATDVKFGSTSATNFDVQIIL